MARMNLVGKPRRSLSRHSSHRYVKVSSLASLNFDRQAEDLLVLSPGFYETECSASSCLVAGSTTEEVL